MTASSFYKKLFTKKHLYDLYFSSVRYRASVGIDKINRRVFESNIDENIDIIYRKVRSGTYKFTPYREKLISRGSKKLPRIVSIPTIRDKLTLKALYEVLQAVYQNQTPFVHRIINDVSVALSANEFDGVLRLDVKDFYPSVDHSLLFKQINKRIRKNEILILITNSLKQPTVAKIKRDEIQPNDIGIPQGLSISNILANIYLFEIDEKYLNRDSLKYFRYVDDILVLCKCNELESIKLEIDTDFEKQALRIHDDDQEKSLSCQIGEGFSYLGYVFDKGIITVRKKSIDFLRESILKLFTNFKYSKSHEFKLLKWSVDLRITGCIFNETKYGWLFFFSQINDLQLLNSLDHFIQKLLTRFEIDPSKINLKKFIRSYHEIKNNLRQTKYIPNFDEYSTSDKRRILSDIFGLKTQLLRSSDIDYEFNKKIYQTVRDLEKDLARAS